MMQEGLLSVLVICQAVQAAGSCPVTVLGARNLDEVSGTMIRPQMAELNG